MTRLNIWWFLLMVIGLWGCATAPPLPPVNLQEPGWTVREGQAVWKKSREAPEITGEILLATGPEGRVFVQFSKNPFPIMIAQATAKTWEVEVPTQNKRYSGHGRPPARLIWLWLPRVLSGQPPPRGWAWPRIDNSGWRLENSTTGESLEVYFNE